jgi:two-component system, NarL family, nitrate/nitrite response regulator NarL
MATKSRKRISILLADDHPVVREGLRSCLAGYRHIVVSGEALNGLEAVAKAKRLRPDVVLMDINLPQMDGLKATERLSKEAPDVKVLALTAHQNQEYVHGIVAMGARGYVLKDASPEQLVEAIETVDRGESFFSPEIVHTLVRTLAAQAEANAQPKPAPLSPREREVIVMIAEGLANKEIAGRLGVGVRTVETHRERLMNKLNIRTVAGLTRYALAQGLVRAQPSP